MANLYDVVFLGIKPDLPDRKATIAGIAKVLEADVEEIEYLLDNNISTAVKKSVPLRAARKYQVDILRLGGLSKYRPTLKLELAPLEEAKPAEATFVCPACDFRQNFPSEAELPVMCPQCGIIPSKYDKLAALKEEREKMKKRLLEMQKAREEQTQAINEQQELEARRRQMEEEIRKELGLPRMLNSRLRIFGSAAFLWMLGIGMGGGGASFYYRVIAEENVNAALAAGGGGTDALLNPFDNNSQISPQQDTLQQVFALSRRPNRAGGEPETPVPAADPAPAAGSKAGRLDTRAIWQDMPQDREWDLFLAAQARRQIDLQQQVKAYHLADAIASPRVKIATWGQIAEQFYKAKDIANGENLFNLMANFANNLQDGGERVEAQGLLAMSLFRVGNIEKAHEILQTTEKLALTRGNPADTARALARVASYQSQTGKQAQADANFRRVNTLIHSLNDNSALLRAYARLAASYAESGNRAVAMAILNETLNASGQVKDKAEENRLLGELAEAFVSLGDTDSALLAVAKLEPASKDKALYKLACELAYADRLYDAMKIMDKIEPPEFKARAATLVSRMQRSHPDMLALAASSWDKATAAQGQIQSAQDQSIVRGEIARYLAHAGQPQSVVEDWARKAMASTQAIDTQAERDIALALLAANLARANQAKLAGDAIKLIQTPVITDSADKDAFKVSRIFGEI